MTTPFWSNEPTILFNSDSILQVWPSPQMNFEAKLNAISRIVIVLSVLGFIFTMKPHFLVIGAITLAIIVSLYRYRKQTIVTNLQENFAQRPSPKKNSNKFSPASFTTNPVTLDTVLRSDFHPTTKQNPFGNVLLSPGANCALSQNIVFGSLKYVAGNTRHVLVKLKNFGSTSV